MAAEVVRTETPNSGFSNFTTGLYAGLVLLLGTLSIVVTQIALNASTAVALDTGSADGALLIGIVSAWVLAILIGIISYYFESWRTRFRPDRRSAWTWAAYGMLIAVVLLLADVHVFPVLWMEQEVRAVSQTVQIRLLLPVSIVPCSILLIWDREKRRLSRYTESEYIRPGSP